MLGYMRILSLNRSHPTTVEFEEVTGKHFTLFSPLFECTIPLKEVSNIRPEMLSSDFDRVELTLNDITITLDDSKVIIQPQPQHQSQIASMKVAMKISDRALGGLHFVRVKILFKGLTEAVFGRSTMRVKCLRTIAPVPKGSLSWNL